jgi:ABC-type glutathione transport system ATPase component
MSDIAALQLNSIGKRFSNVDVLEDIDLTVMPGEIICLVGRSGCGKSTLLRIIAGVETPDAGAIMMNGREIAGPTIFRRRDPSRRPALQPAISRTPPTDRGDRVTDAAGTTDDGRRTTDNGRSTDQADAGRNAPRRGTADRHDSPAMTLPSVMPC